MTSQNPRSTFSAICISNGLVRVRTRATIGPRNCVDYSRASASHPAVWFPFGSAIRALTSLWRGRLAGKLERSGPFSVRFPAFVTSYKGPRAGFVNLCRRFQVSGNLSSFRIPFVYDPEKSTRGILKTLCLSPVPILSLAAVHAVNLSEDQKHDVPKKCGF